jgi:hypothetical protein
MGSINSFDTYKLFAHVSNIILCARGTIYRGLDWLVFCYHLAIALSLEGDVLCAVAIIFGPNAFSIYVASLALRSRLGDESSVDPDVQVQATRTPSILYGDNELRGGSE